MEPSAAGLIDTIPHSIDILLAEPDAAVRDAMRLLFETLGFTVHTTANAGDLENLLRLLTPRCLVLASELGKSELGTPGGVALLLQLRERGIAIPAIVTANQGGVPLAVEAMRAGAADFLEKPLLDARLLLAVKRVMK